MMVIENKYEIGSSVYLNTDVEQLKRIIISIQIFKQGELLYEIICGTSVSKHYEFELSDQENIEIKTSA